MASCYIADETKLAQNQWEVAQQKQQKTVYKEKKILIQLKNVFEDDDNDIENF